MNPRNPIILCVDDEEANLKLLENILVPRGYIVVRAASGKAALQEIRRQTIDLVLLDIIMPGMNGFEVCRQIKEDPKLRNIPIILITVLTEKQDRIHGIEAGAEEFLSKPFDQPEVLARIKILLRVKELSDERLQAEKALKQSHNELDRQVRERTAELAQANEMLQADINERMRAEEKLRNSLVEKEILLKEVHHRVKNNLMIIIGLIKMQGAKADSEMLNPLLKELEGRIRSMALVHESLHKSGDLARINLQSYIELLTAHIHAQFGAERDIRFSVQAASVGVSMDIAVPCGLILNELITNAYKHAFPTGRPGSGAGKCEINIVVLQEGGMNVMTVADNGVGLPPGLDWEQSETLGLKLIRMLSQQLNGSIALDRTRGTAFHLHFALPAAGR